MHTNPILARREPWVAREGSARPAAWHPSIARRWALGSLAGAPPERRCINCGTGLRAAPKPRRRRRSPRGRCAGKIIKRTPLRPKHPDIDPSCLDTRLGVINQRAHHASQRTDRAQVGVVGGARLHVRGAAAEDAVARPLAEIAEHVDAYM